MTATNHVLAGALIATQVSNPIIALPVALLSHILLDVMPHYGNPDHTGKRFLYMLAADAGIAAAVLLSIAILQPADAWLIIAAGVVGASPDLLWLPHWLRELQNKPAKPMSALERFLARIQWGERSWGMLIEFPFAALLLYVLITSLY